MTPTLHELHSSLKLYSQNFLLLLTACTLVLLGSIFSLGIFAGPLWMGLITLCQQLQWGEKGSLSVILHHLPRTVPCLAPTACALLIGLIGIPICHIPILGFLWIIGIYPLVLLGALLALGFIIHQDLSVEYALKRTLAIIMINPAKAWVSSAIPCGIALTGVALSRWLAFSTLTFVPGLIFFFLSILPVPLAALGLTTLYKSWISQKPTVVFVKKATLQIAVITLAILIIIGFIFQAVDKPKNLPEKDSLKTSSRRIKNAKLSVGKTFPRFNGPLPKGFPSDIPVHPKAKTGSHLDYFRFSQGQSLTVFPVAERAEKVFAYYRSILKAEGWSIRAYPQEPLENIVFRKPGRQGILTIRRDQGSSQVYIRLE